MGSSRPCFHIDGQTEYSRLQGHALYLVGPARRSVLWTVKTDWNNQAIGIERNWCVWAEHWKTNGRNTTRDTIKQHNNARPHVAKVVKTYLETLKWEVLPHPPLYSPDVAPSDYHLFRSMAHGLADQHFRSYEEIKNWIDSWIASKDDQFFRREIHYPKDGRK